MDPNQRSHLNRSGTGVEWEDEYGAHDYGGVVQPYEEAVQRRPPMEYAGYRQHSGPQQQQPMAPPQMTTKERRNDPLQRLLHSLELSPYYPLFVKNEVVYSGEAAVFSSRDLVTSPWLCSADLPDLTEADLTAIGVRSRLAARERERESSSAIP